MVWNFFKKILDKKEEKRQETEPRAAFRQNTRIQQAVSPAPATPQPASGPAESAKVGQAGGGVIQASESDSGLSRASGAVRDHGGVKQIVEPSKAEKPAPAKEKPHAEKTDEELAKELNVISPEILSQAKNPQMRKLIIDIYRKMLIEGVDIKDEKEVKRWLKKHPEVVNGGEAHKIETFKREEPKVGRNDACTCGSGRKYKKCCGKGK